MSEGVDPALADLIDSDHSQWLARHRDAARVAEEWLDGILAEPSTELPRRSATPSSLTDRAATVPADPEAPRHDGGDWRIDIDTGGTVVARHGESGAVFTGSLAVAATPDGIRLRLRRYEYVVPDGFVTSGPPAPLASIERAVNAPAMARAVLESIDEAPAAVTELPPLRIPSALLRGRPRSDEFYRMVARYVTTCRDQKITYGARLAADNRVSEGTVRSWVHEARRRGFLEPARPTPRSTSRRASAR